MLSSTKDKVQLRSCSNGFLPTHQRANIDPETVDLPTLLIHCQQSNTLLLNQSVHLRLRWWIPVKITTLLTTAEWLIEAYTTDFAATNLQERFSNCFTSTITSNVATLNKLVTLQSTKVYLIKIYRWSVQRILLTRRNLFNNKAKGGWLQTWTHLHLTLVGRSWRYLIDYSSFTTCSLVNSRRTSW